MPNLPPLRLSLLSLSVPSTHQLITQFTPSIHYAKSDESGNLDDRIGAPLAPKPPLLASSYR